MAAHVLVVDDQSNVRSTIAYLLEKEGFRVTKAASGQEALALLEGREFEFALIDVKMARMDGLELLRRIRARWPGVAVILMTAYASIPSAVDAMKMGAAHYLEKPFTKEKLLEAFERAKVDFGGGAAAAGKENPFDDVVGTSQAVTDAVELARKNASNDKPILLIGEFGTGREALARAVHAASPRAAGPFVPVRCSVLGDHLGADVFTPGGRLTEASGGTIFLDGVHALSEEDQAKLLAYVQDGEVPAAGGGPTLRSDARVMASTDADLDAAVAEGTFRKDLHLRLRAIQLRLPPLRDRRGDIPRLAQHYARKHKPRSGAPVRFGREALQQLAALPLEGNLRELEDLVEQAVGLAAPEGEVTPAVLQRLGVEVEGEPESGSSAMRTRVEVEEKRAIEEELRKNPRNLKQVAKNLNISRTTLWRKMKKYEITPD